MAADLRSVCVFCGSSVGNRPEYAEAAASLGRELAARGLRLVYGGGSVGLMGIVADSVLDAGGAVLGVIPRVLARKELIHPRVGDMQVTETMHTRKALMAESSDGFIALPGGFGTFEELFEMITWSQLGIHQKNIGLLNVAGFFDNFFELVDRAVDDGFIKARNRALIQVSDSPTELLDRVLRRPPPDEPKYASLEQT
jgi:uncharacterized protein (TIGR00730 family)